MTPAVLTVGAIAFGILAWWKSDERRGPSLIVGLLSVIAVLFAIAAGASAGRMT